MSILLKALVAVASCGAAGEDSGPLPTFAETCFQFRPAGSFLPLADAQRMLEGVGQDSRIYSGDRKKVRLKGLFRVRDWTPESAVRVACSEWGYHLRFYVWGEGHGVAIFASPAGAAYRITQQPGEALTKQDIRLSLGPLVATDDHRCARLPAPNGPFQIRCQDGAVVVTKGNVRLLTVPLEGPATNLYVQVPYDATLQDLAMFRSGPAPEEIAPAHRLVLDGARPAALPWKAALPKGARFQKGSDGNVELAVENTTEMAVASVAAGKPGLFEVVVQVDEATPGTGIALLDDKGEALDGIEFGREGQSLAFGFGSPKVQVWLGNFDPINHPIPLAGPRQWLRLVAAAGCCKCWISGDGVHWGRVLEAHEWTGSWKSIALFARATVAGNPDSSARHVRLRYLQVRELDGLTAAAPTALLAKAAAAGVALKADEGELLPAWTLRIGSMAPAASSLVAWRYACTLQALADKVHIDAADGMLYRAVRDRMSELPTVRAKIDLLLDAALVWRCRQDSVQRLLELWDRLGREVVNAGSRADFATYQQALMQASIAEAPEHGGPISWELVRDSLMLFYAADRTTDLTRLADTLVFWRSCDAQIGSWPVSDQLRQLLLWLNVSPEGLNGRRGRRGAKPRVTVSDTARVAMPPLSRAATNLISELQSALETKQYADAAKVLVGCEPPRDEGLVPAPGDGQLYVSFQVALRGLLLEHPGLGEAMTGQIGPADQLKIEQTLNRGEPAAVEALTVQYCGSPAAVLPCQWLGDRALAATEFSRALSWYDEGLRWTSPAQQPELAARKRLAAAMLGMVQGQPPTKPVSLGSVKVSPEKFEGWIREQLARRRGAGEAAFSADALPVVAATQPVLYQAASFGRLDDRNGRGFKTDGLSYPLSQQAQAVDWTWRQLTVLGGEDSLIAAQRARITAFDLTAGKVRWDATLGNGWSLGPVRPLVCGRRVYVRASVAADRTGVLCLDGRTGRKLWLSDCRGSAAGDPLWCRGRLFVMTIGPAAGDFVSSLCLVELHPETGDVLSKRQILETAQRDKLSCECQTSWADNRLVVLLAGSVICADLQGRVSWLREETALPPEQDPLFVQQDCQPAIESNGRLFVQQPGSCAIDCLDLETGHRYWRRGILGLERMADLPDDRLLAKTARGFVAINKTTGEVLWQREHPGMLSALARTSSGLILAARQANVADKPHLVFLWIDPATGETRAHGPVAMEKNQQFFFGPIAARGDRTWCCFGYGATNDENPKRIIELQPGKPALPDEPL